MSTIPINFHLIEVISENVAETDVFCIKNPKSPGFLKKIDWLAPSGFGTYTLIKDGK